MALFSGRTGQSLIIGIMSTYLPGVSGECAVAPAEPASNAPSSGACPAALRSVALSGEAAAGGSPYSSRAGSKKGSRRSLSEGHGINADTLPDQISL